MARMIPPEVYADTPSRGERELFRRLRDDPGTRDWVVLHSLDVANHRKQVTGEIDFLVIAPSKGVLCVEVKACKSVRRGQGRWYYGESDAKGDVRGPFKQSSEAMHSLRNRVVKRYPDLGRVPFASCVAFTDCSFGEESEEWHPWQVLDAAQFISKPVSALFGRVLDLMRERLAQTPTVAGWFRPDSAEPTEEQTRALANLLRPDFEFYESPKARAAKREEDLKRYTDEQLVALDAMAANPRVVFAGPAGTGKTLLAIEAARRAAAGGSRVLFLCFNSQLGRWLERETEALAPGVTTGTLHKRMLAASGAADRVRADDQQFWLEELPALAVDRMLGGSDEHVYDELILDEAQDVLRDSYLDFLDLSLKGGLAAGRWRFFGDFERQAIYDSTLTIEDAVAGRLGGAPVYSLRVNCRNKPLVAELVHQLGGLNPSYNRVLRPDDGVHPALRYYEDGAAQQALLTEALDELSREGFAPSEIAVLSTRTPSSSSSAQVTSGPWKDRLRPLGVASGKQVGYTSVHAFKGLEAGAVIVTDIEGISEAADIFYIAATRALHRLVLLIDTNAKQDVLDIITGGRS